MPNTEPRPMIPALAPLYAHTADIAWLIVRVTAGLMLLPHGIPKVFNQGVAAFAAAGLAEARHRAGAAACVHRRVS
jgi:uncharacterized membrane protein YphA (DoxX/SURF4 family)